MLRALTMLVLLISMFLVACNNNDDESSNDNTSNETPQDTNNPTETPDNEPPTLESTPSDDSAPQTETVWVVIGDEPVNVYECPEVTCDVVNTLFPGTTLDVVSTEDDWHEIRLNDSETAYIEVASTQEEDRLLPPENSSLPPGVTPSDGTAAIDGPPSLSAPPGQPTFSGTMPSTDSPPSDSSLPPGVPTQDGTTTPNVNSDGPPNITSEPPPGVSN